MENRLRIILSIDSYDFSDKQEDSQLMTVGHASVGNTVVQRDFRHLLETVADVTTALTTRQSVLQHRQVLNAGLATTVWRALQHRHHVLLDTSLHPQGLMHVHLAQQVFTAQVVIIQTKLFARHTVTVRKVCIYISSGNRDIHFNPLMPRMSKKSFG